MIIYRSLKIIETIVFNAGAQSYCRFSGPKVTTCSIDLVDDPMKVKQDFVKQLGSVVKTINYSHHRHITTARIIHVETWVLSLRRVDCNHACLDLCDRLEHLVPMDVSPFGKVEL